jgi:hypothetical protein
VTEGDSLTQAHYPVNLAALLPAWQVSDVALGGARLADIITDFPTQVLPLFDARRERNIILLRIGTNDILDSSSAAYILAGITTYCGMAIAAGFKIIVGTITTATVAHYTAPMQTVRGTVNSGILSNSIGATAIWDVAALPQLADPTDLTWYTDGLHCITASSNSLIAASALSAMNAL